MKRTWQIGVRADKALTIIGEKGPQRMSSLLYALGISTKTSSSFKATVQKLVNAKILNWTDSADPILSLTAPEFANPAIAREVYDAHASERRVASNRATEREKALALVLATSTRSMIEDIAFGMAEQGALK